MIEYEFLALDKCGEKAEWLCHFIEDIPIWKNLCHKPVYIVIANLRLEEHRVTCIMVSLDIYVADIIPLDNYFQLELSLLTT